MIKLTLNDLVLKSRKKLLEVAYNCNGPSHLGGGLSMIEIFSVLYGSILQYNISDPNWAFRDRFILSKGHGVLPYFIALHYAGFITEEKLFTYKTNESDLISHPIMNMQIGMESSNGSLGHGLSMAVGLCLGMKKKGNFQSKTYVILGDGECNEGSVWEAMMSAAHFKLDNLIAIVDYNKLQNDGCNTEVMDIGDLESKWKSFGWEVSSVNGHDIDELEKTLKTKNTPNKPKVLIAHTVKGKGVSFMENNNEWHHNRLTESTYTQAMQELKSQEI